MPIDQLIPEFVEAFPTPMQPAVLYVSIVYRTTGHLCCCGCGEEVIAPLAPAQWALTYDGDTVSLHPSIGNWTLPCKSHYVIRRNQVLARRPFTREEIVENRSHDRAALARYDDELTEVGTPPVTQQPDAAHPVRSREIWWMRLLHLRR